VKKVNAIGLILGLFLFGFSSPDLSAQKTDSGFEYFAHLGLAFSDFEGLYLDIGVEKAFTEKLSAQVFLDYYPNPVDLGDFYEDFSTSAYGIGVYGKYNLFDSDKLGFYARGGLHLTFLTMNYDWFGEEIELASETKLGLGGGAGFEYTLSDNMKLLVDGTVRTLFGDEALTFFVISAGVKLSL